MKKLGKQTIKLDKPVNILGYYSIVGKKEGEGNFKDYFDFIIKNDKFGENTFEHAESKILRRCIECAILKSKIKKENIQALFSGDLLNQITASSFAARELNIPFFGVYGACSTMGETLALASCMIEGGALDNAIAATGSHFSTAERQYRFPLELGNQRPPTAQWTVTAAGSTVLGYSKSSKIAITHITIGKIIDFGIKDVNNMGAAMAPAAMDTIVAHLKETKRDMKFYDLIVTGDLGKFGSEILLDLMANKNLPLGNNYNDCGQMMFNDSQRTFQGASGCGCSASVLNSYIFKKMEKGELKKVLFAPTGALLSSLSTQQGDSIPGVCYAISFERIEQQ